MDALTAMPGSEEEIAAATEDGVKLDTMTVMTDSKIPERLWIPP